MQSAFDDMDDSKAQRDLANHAAKRFQQNKQSHDLLIDTLLLVCIDLLHTGPETYQEQ